MATWNNSLCLTRARRVHAHAGRQIPHGRSLLGRRDRRTRGRRQVIVKAGTGGRHDSTTASLEPHSGMNSRCRVTGSRTLEPQQYHSNTTALRRIVPPRRHGGLFVLLARRVSDRVHGLIENLIARSRDRVAFDEGGVKQNPENREKLRLVCQIASGGKLAIWGSLQTVPQSRPVLSITVH